MKTDDGQLKLELQPLEGLEVTSGSVLEMAEKKTQVPDREKGSCKKPQAPMK